MSKQMELVVALLENFAGLVSLHMLRAGLDRGDCAANLRRTQTRIVMGRKFAKVDVGRGYMGPESTADWSGRYMVDLETLEIFGIRAYGIVNRGHRYGTLATIGDWNWGEYTAVKRPQHEIEAGWWEATRAVESGPVPTAVEDFEDRFRPLAIDDDSTSGSVN